MVHKKSRLVTVIIGFFVFLIPLYFFCDNLNKLYLSTQEKIQENTKEKLLNFAKELENNINPFNYLKSEFNRIHAELIPDFPDEIISGIPEDSYINSIYSEKLFKKLLNLTKSRFTPIMVSMGSNNFKDIYSYLCPDLINQIKNEIKKDKKNRTDLRYLPYAKAWIDSDNVERKFRYNFDLNYRIDFNSIHKLKFGDDYYNNLCLKYLSRYKSMKRNLYPIYTDYFKKQTLFPILKCTLSKKGVHGYYSLMIPQSCIDPELILKSVIQNNKSNIKIELIESNKPPYISETNNGYEYFLNLSGDFITQVKAYTRLNGGNTKILKNQFKLSIEFPKELKNLELTNYIAKILSIIIMILYLAASIFLLISNYKPHIKLSSKLVYILSLIIILPIVGLGLLIWISVQNIDQLIDYNVSKKLHNTLEKYIIRNDENSLRRLSAIFEIKRKFYNRNFEKEIKNKNIFSQDERDWLYAWNNDDLLFISEKDKFYEIRKQIGDCFEPEKGTKEERNYYKKGGIYHKFILSKYANNLNFIKSSKDDSKQIFALSVLEEYMNNKIEEKSVGQESIPHRNLMKLVKTNSTVYFYANDNNKGKFFFESRIAGEESSPYLYINEYSDKIDSLWFKTSDKYHDSNLGIILNIDHDKKRVQWPPINASTKEVNNLLTNTINYKDSGSEKIKDKNVSLIKEWFFNENNPFIIGGVAKANYQNTLSYSLNMIFPILLSYAILLLLILTNFIALFINKPMKIFKEGIKRLDNNQYGTTINPFSGDEFNNITLAFNEMSIAIKQREQIKRYVSDKLIQSVSQNKIQEAGTGKQEKVTILSSDIRNFTGTSEKYEPSVIVEMLNIYFTKMQKAISDNGGIIDKYIGDAIQAVFYDEPNKENQVIRAAKAALSMRKSLKEFNNERQENGLFTIENGIGIDTDFAITGTIGTTNGRKDFSVNGDVIARAAELEAKTKVTESKILLSKKSLEELHTNKPLIEEVKPLSGGDGDLTREKANSMNKPSSQENWIAMQSSTARNDGYNSNIDNDNKTNHTTPPSQTTHHSEAQASLPNPSSLLPKLVYKEFDNDSVELIDVI